MLRNILFILVATLALTCAATEYTLRATKYHPGQGGAGWVTASGDRINYNRLKNYEIHWVALSPDMFSRYGFRLGDTIIVESDVCPKLNGEWIVKDKMGRHLRKRIDFLTPRGDNYNFRSNSTVRIRKKK